jgi:hypothetical protein
MTDDLVLKKFADQYTRSRYEEIRFAWNGKHANEFQDANIIFRSDLCRYLIPILDQVNLLLIRDLFEAESSCAKEAWGINSYYHSLGKQLITRGRSVYLFDFLEGVRQSFDTYLAGRKCLSEITGDERKEIESYIDSRLQTETQKFILNYLEFGKSYFSNE